MQEQLLMPLQNLPMFLPLSHSTTTPLQHSPTPALPHSSTPPLQLSTTPQLRYSTSAQPLSAPLQFLRQDVVVIELRQERDWDTVLRGLHGDRGRRRSEEH